MRGATTIVILFLLGLAGCAERIIQSPADLVPGQLAGGAVSIIIDADAKVRSSVGVARTLSSGSVWDYSGRIAEGAVYRPRNTVLTVEGANVSEAHMVLQDRSFVGFYLPVQGTFSPAEEPVALQFSTTR